MKKKLSGTPAVLLCGGRWASRSQTEWLIPQDVTRAGATSLAEVGVQVVVRVTRRTASRESNFIFCFQFLWRFSYGFAREEKAKRIHRQPNRKRIQDQSNTTTQEKISHGGFQVTDVEPRHLELRAPVLGKLIRR